MVTFSDFLAASLANQDELGRCCAGGLWASLLTHGISLPPILALGTEKQKEMYAKESKLDGILHTPGQMRQNDRKDKGIRKEHDKTQLILTHEKTGSSSSLQIASTSQFSALGCDVMAIRQTFTTSEKLSTFRNGVPETQLFFTTPFYTIWYYFDVIWRIKNFVFSKNGDWKTIIFAIPGQEIITGRKRASLAITEPSGGSDVANLATTAVREKDVYVPCHQVLGGFHCEIPVVASFRAKLAKNAWICVGGVCFMVGALSPLATFDSLVKWIWNTCRNLQFLSQLL